jgi:hypothetical protein
MSYCVFLTGGKEENTIRHIPSNKQLEVKRKHNKTYTLQQVTGGKEENTIRHMPSNK